MFYIGVLSINLVYHSKYGQGIFWKDRVYGIDGGEDLNKQKWDKID